MKNKIEIVEAEKNPEPLSDGIYAAETHFNQKRLLIIRDGKMVCQIDTDDDNIPSVQYNPNFYIYKNIRKVKNLYVKAEV